MKRQFIPRMQYSSARLLRRLDRAAYRINPYLLALAIGLIIVNVTFFIGMKISPPRPVNPVSSVQITSTP
jgi:hypothetical protein